MGYRDDLKTKLVDRARTRHAAIYNRVVLLVNESIKLGSPITGAPGQPVDTGALRNSYLIEKLADFDTKISSILVYAKPIEDGIGPYGPMKVRSAVGGFHSIKLTVAGFSRIVEHVTREVVGAP